MIDLTPFCSTTESRFMRPYSVGDVTFATDGNIAVQILRRLDVPECPTAPDLRHLFAGPAPSGAPPAIALPRKAAMIDLGCSVTFPWGCFAQRYVRLIWELPELRIAPGPTRLSAMGFAFAFGRGLVMPMTEPCVRNMIIAEEVAA